MMTPLLDTSLPLRECGLKYHKDMLPRIGCPVTPLAGVWIEICLARVTANKSLVTPLAGVWIEIPKSLSLYPSFRVTPLAGVWIEIQLLAHVFTACYVTPLAGVWIEIVSIIYGYKGVEGHSPCGSVD